MKFILHSTFLITIASCMYLTTAARRQCDVSLSVSHPSCLGTGAVTVKTPSGSDYTFSKDGLTYQSSPYFPGLSSGSYTIYAKKNDNSCTASESITLAETACDYSSCNADLYWNDEMGNIGTFNVRTNAYTQICAGSSVVMGDIGIDQYGQMWGVGLYTDSLYRIDMDDCTYIPVAQLPFSAPNSLSVLPDGSFLMGAGGLGASTVYRYNPVTNSFGIWYDLGAGNANGDFIFLSGDVYVLWFDDAIDPLSGHIYKVTVDANYDYQTHIDMGAIQPLSFGLAKVDGQLYAATSIGAGTGDIPYAGTLINIPLPDVTNWTEVYGDPLSHYYGATSYQEALVTELPVMSSYNVVLGCPQTTVDLSTLLTSSTPPGISVAWFTNDSHSGTPLDAFQIANAAEGAYYAFFYNSATDCYSSASSVVTINECQVVLPIVFGSFTVFRESTSSFLKWNTLTELNNRGFDVLRSSDGVSWSSIGYVNSKADNGNSTTIVEYNFTDNAPLSGKNYYCIKQTDKDGRVKYSPIRSLNFGDHLPALRIYPNPVRSGFTVEGLKGATTIRLINMIGQIVNTTTTTGETVKYISVSHVPKGVYSLQITNNTGIVSVEKIIRQ